MSNSIRHYCDGHEYSYSEPAKNRGIVRDYMSRAPVALLDIDTTFETVSVYPIGADVDINEPVTIHANDPSVASFKLRAMFAIQSYVASTY